MQLQDTGTSARQFPEWPTRSRLNFLWRREHRPTTFSTLGFIACIYVARLQRSLNAISA